LAGNNTNWDGWVTPDLARNPGLAMDALNSKQPDVNGVVLSHAAKGVGIVDAINDHADTNGTQSFWSKILTPGIQTLDFLNKGIKEVQKDYKFVHSVYTDVGFVPGFLATAAIVGAGVAGTVAGGALGGVAATDAAAFAVRKTLGNVYKQSYAKSEDPNYKVSPGRDFTNVVSKAADAVGQEGISKMFKAQEGGAGVGGKLSGATDTLFDIGFDPFQILGRFGQAMRGAKYLEKAAEVQVKLPLFKANEGVKNFVASRSLVPVNSTQMDLLKAGSGVTVKGMDVLNASSRRYNAALEDIATIARDTKSTSTASAQEVATGIIATRYPELGTIAPARLANLKTADKVHDFFKTTLYFTEMEGTLAGKAMLPSRTLLRAKASDTKVADVLRNAIVPKYIQDVADPTGKALIKNPEWKQYGVQRNLATVYKTFTGYMPYSIDADTLKLSRTQFKWDAPDAALTVARIARIGMGDLGSKELAGRYAQAVALGGQEGLGLARNIKNQAITEAVKALGLPNADNFVKDAFDNINKLDGPLVSNFVSGVTPAGEALGTYITSEGLKSGAIYDHQAENMFNIPDFLQIKKAMRDAGGVMKAFGKLDEWTANHYINKIFKPLALGTAGFGFRVAAAELLPTLSRYGFVDTFKAKLAVSAAKANVEVMPEEAPHIMSAALSSLGAMLYGIPADVTTDFLKTGFPIFNEAKRYGLKYASKLLPEQQLDLATRVVVSNGAQFVPDAAIAGGGHDASQAYDFGMQAHYVHVINSKNVYFKQKEEWTTINSSDIHFAPRLGTNLNQAAHNPEQRNIANDLLSTWKQHISGSAQFVPEAGKELQYEQYQKLRSDLVDKELARMQASLAGKYEPYNYSRNAVSRWVDSGRDGSLRAFAQDRVDGTLGLLIARDGTLMDGVASNVAKGVGTDYNLIATLARKDPNKLPNSVSSPIMEAYHPGKDVANWLVNITNLGFKKIIDPIINGIAREPLYMLHVGDSYARLVPRIKEGILTEDQALRIAQTQATYGMIPQIHNVALRSQFAQLARNFLPFYFAQEQALKRAYRAMKETSTFSPIFSKTLRYYQVVEQGLSNPAFIQQDDQGNKFMYLPVVGAFGEGVQSVFSNLGFPLVTGLPVTGKGNLISLKSVLPELQTPGVAPFMAISGNFVADIFPFMKPAVQGTIGKIAMDRSIIDILVPSASLKTLISGLTPIDLNNQMSNAIADAAAASFFHGQTPGPDANYQQRQNHVDRLKFNALSSLMIKAFMGFYSPLSLQVSQEDAGFRDEFWNLVKKTGDIGQAKLEFFKAHGDRAVAYTVGKTESAIPGFHMPYTQKALDYIQANKNLFAENSHVGTGAYFLIPQDNAKNESDRSVYNTIMNMNFRKERTPNQLLENFYIAQGDEVMSPQIQQHTALLKQYQYIPELKAMENTRWQNVMKTMSNLYPTWYDNYTDPSRRNMAKTAVNQLNQIFSQPIDKQPNHDQAKAVKDLLMQYNDYKAKTSQYSQLNIQPTILATMKQDWEDKLMILADEKPELKTIINSVFLKLG
jgi:hypothetical protein